MSAFTRARRPLRRPSPATLIASLALFVALGGGSVYAAGRIHAGGIAKNAVRSRHIKDGQVRTQDLRDGAVTAAKVAPDGLTGAQIDETTLSTRPSGAAGGDLAGSYPSPAIGAGRVGSAAVADNSLTGTDINEATFSTRPSGPAGGDLAGSYPSPAIGAGKVGSAAVADDSLTGADIDESTLGRVPDASRLGGVAASDYLRGHAYKRESAMSWGTQRSDKSWVASEACLPGDLLLSGGPANIDADTTLLESFPSPGSTSSWTVRIIKLGAPDSFSIVVLCLDLPASN